MTDLLLKMVEQAPGLGVLAFIVWMFLKHIKSYNEMLRDLNKENMEARQHSREVIEKNTEAMGKNTEALHDMAHVIRNMKA